MPSYCTAINCKSNGFTNPDLSFFKFPFTRLKILDHWVKAMKRDRNWQPTKHSRLCSIHFSESCFFRKKGSRLRLLPSSVPTIFDFRTLKNNRKKAKENALLDMDETECPELDKNLYELETDITVNYSRRKGQKCRICSGQADCDITLDSVVNTKKGKISLHFIITSIYSYKLSSKLPNFICISCSHRLINSFRLRMDLDECEGKINEKEQKEKCSNDEESDDQLEEPEINVKLPKVSSLLYIDPLSTRPKTPPLEVEEDLKNMSIYCASCNITFFKNDLTKHLLLPCQMKVEADLKNIPSPRQLYVCCFCRFLLYKHNSSDHLITCGKIKIEKSKDYKEDPIDDAELLLENNINTNENEIADELFIPPLVYF